jgi:hypothetical protein
MVTMAGTNLEAKMKPPPGMPAAELGGAILMQFAVQFLQ